MSRIIYNAQCDKYDSLFKGTLSGGTIEQIFKGLLPTANAVLDKKYDKDIVDDEVKKALMEFEAQNSERSRFEHYYEIPLEDWFLLLRLFFLDNPDLNDMWKASKKGFEWLILDAIYNDGKIQEIYQKMKKPVKRFFQSFDSIFTLNYDNNIEKLTNKTVYHLHGDYSVLTDSENPETVQGFLNKQNGKIEMDPGYSQCYCNALLNFSGQNKYKEAQDKAKEIETLQRLKQLHDTDVTEFEIMRAGVKSELAQSIIDTYIKHPELKIATDYHFGELEKLSGELHIIGLSPQNDSHIFACIEKSSLDKIVFYSYGEPPKTLPLTKTYEFADIKQLWKSLDASQPRYNCGRKFSDEQKRYFKIFNALSLDPITEDEIEKEVNSIPEYIANQLCKEAMELVKVQKTPKSEEEIFKQFRMVSKIALREGIYPSAFYLLLIDNYKKLSVNR